MSPSSKLKDDRMKNIKLHLTDSTQTFYSENRTYFIKAYVYHDIISDQCFAEIVDSNIEPINHHELTFRNSNSALKFKFKQDLIQIILT